MDFIKLNQEVSMIKKIIMLASVIIVFSINNLSASEETTISPNFGIAQSAKVLQEQIIGHSDRVEKEHQVWLEEYNQINRAGNITTGSGVGLYCLSIYSMSKRRTLTSLALFAAGTLLYIPGCAVKENARTSFIKHKRQLQGEYDKISNLQKQLDSRLPPLKISPVIPQIKRVPFISSDSAFIGDHSVIKPQRTIYPTASQPNHSHLFAHFDFYGCAL